MRHSTQVPPDPGTLGPGENSPSPGAAFPLLSVIPPPHRREYVGGEAGSGGGLGALTAPVGTFSAASHRPSTLRSPAFASSIILLGIISAVRSARRLTAARAVSKATPMRRVVSGSKVWPLKIRSNGHRGVLLKAS